MTSPHDLPLPELVRISETEWEIPSSFAPFMKTSARVVASELLLSKMKEDRTLRQLANMTSLPGIVKYPMAMPDAHEGYGFPIGGVVALDRESGGISPGAIGYDINCGMRMLRTNLKFSDAVPKMRDLLEELHSRVPSGVGRVSKRKLSNSEFDTISTEGARFLVEKLGMGKEADLLSCEEGGRMNGANPDKFSEEAKKRGVAQLGTLGAGNHFLEIQKVADVSLAPEAQAFGLFKDQLVVMIHCGSRGFGHQICSDYLRAIEDKFKAEISSLPDRELAYAPAGTKEAEAYFSAMTCAVNFAFANRQAIMHAVRQSFEKVFAKSYESLGMELVYDVCHNIAKIEEHEGKKCFLHRKGATRAFGPGRKEVPAHYRQVGQPVILPGSMGTASYVLVGSEKAMQVSFGSTAHGAGRRMGRGEALRTHRGEEVVKSLQSKGISVKCDSWRSIAEEAPDCYKDVDEVARVSDAAGIGKIVAKTLPLGVVKG